MNPKQPGWYWFLPDENCPTPTGLLRLDRPVIVLVGQDKYTHDGPPARLVVRFGSNCVLYASDMSGDWEPCKEPKRMQREAMGRIKAKMEHFQETN